jgi:hypothetical protein
VIKLLIVLITLLSLSSVNAELRLLSFPGETIKLMLDVDQEVQLNFEKPLSSIGIPTDIKNNIKTQLSMLIVGLVQSGHHFRPHHHQNVTCPCHVMAENLLSRH